MPEIKQQVHEAILKVVRQRSPEIESVDAGQALVGELGLKSLDIARLVAVLEMQVGIDPFARLVSITDIRTVGDLASAYERAAAGESPPLDHSLDASRQRAETRRAAQVRRAEAK